MGDPAGFKTELLEAIRGERALSEAAFNRLALESYARQRTHNALYRRYADSAGAGERLSDWREIPALPVSAFKAGEVAAFDRRRAVKVFKTYVLPAVSSIPVASLVPSFMDLPDSSLSYMAGRVIERFSGGRAFQVVEDSRFRFESLLTFLREREEAGERVLCFAASLAWCGFLDFLEEKSVTLRLPAGSRVLETGGFKGRRTEITRAELLERTEARTGVGPGFVVNEYGMTELSSQFYDRTLAEKKAGKCVPSWTRVRLIDPATGADARAGERGLIQILDLANQGSSIAVRTEDEGEPSAGGFEIVGRREGADLRGCSLTFEEMERLVR